MTTPSSKESAQCAGPSPKQPETMLLARDSWSCLVPKRGRLCLRDTTRTLLARPPAPPAPRRGYRSSACRCPANVAQIRRNDADCAIPAGVSLQKHKQLDGLMETIYLCCVTLPPRLRGVLLTSPCVFQFAFPRWQQLTGDFKTTPASLWI